jgi:anti-sigma regulatory factor (Ser/Thr protein kinase)
MPELARCTSMAHNDVPTLEGAAFELSLPAEPQALRTLRLLAVDFARGVGADEECVQSIAVAINEAASNAVVHAYRNRSAGPIRLAVSTAPGKMVATLSDEGIGEDAAERVGPEVGRGLGLMRALSEAVEVRRGNRGTQVRMVFALRSC